MKLEAEKPEQNDMGEFSDVSKELREKLFGHPSTYHLPIKEIHVK